jgi:hypothetical protein
MRSVLLPAACGLLAMCMVGLSGCRKGTAPASGQASAPSHHHHDHGTSRGVHGGRIIPLEIDNYHGELTYDDKANRIGIYILAEDAATAAPIDAKSVSISATVDDKPSQFTLPAVAQPGEPTGKSSYFELISEPLLAIVTGKTKTPVRDAELNVAIDGQPHVGDINTEPEIVFAAAQDNGGDTLNWKKELSEQGYKISLGHHGVELLAGTKVEPAVQITRDEQPIADAKVFNALLDSDGKTVLVDEVPTIYEPPSTDEPSHYAQGPLKIPSGKRAVVIRYRLILPEGKGERTYDVPVAVK